MSTLNRNRKQPTKSAVIALGLGLVVLFSMPSTGFASDRDRRDHHRPQGHHYSGHNDYDRDHHQYRDHRYRSHDRYGGHHPQRGHHSRYSFTLPRIIRHDHNSIYEYYYRGQSYYGPHGHHHRIYHFPVSAGGYYSSAQYAYCNGEIFYSPQRHHGRFSLHFGF